MSFWKKKLYQHSRTFFSTIPKPTKRMVIALGGNAIKEAGDKGTSTEMFANVKNATSRILNILKNNTDYDYNLCVTHGNGPQVGSLYLQNQLSADTIPPLPLTFLGSMTQGYIGYMLQQSFLNNIHQNDTLKQKFESKGVVTLINQVGISKYDKAFENPSKPIGQFYTKEEAEKLEKENGYTMKEDSGRGYRITVGSPKPLKILELNAVKQLFDDGFIVIATGGGGIPVVIDDDDDNDMLYGKDAVIDKDLTSVLLAKSLNCDTLIIATDGDGIWLNYSDKVNRKKLDNVSVNELTQYYNDGLWGKYGGSMRPKIEAVIKFVNDTGNDAIICDLNHIDQALLGNGGTTIYHQDKLKNTSVS